MFLISITTKVTTRIIRKSKWNKKSQFRKQTWQNSNLITLTLTLNKELAA